MTKNLKEKINIFIPAGGDGSRFKEKNYRTLKPFLIFNNQPLLVSQLNNFKSEKYDIMIHVIIQERYKKEYQTIIENIENKNKHVRFHFIPQKTEGTLCTLFYFSDLINKDEMFLSANCDQLIDLNFDRFIDESKKYDGSLVIFDNDNPNWSFVDISEKKLISKVVDKDPITNFAICGWYFWTKGGDFLKYSLKQLAMNDRTNGEFMQNKPYNYAIDDNLKFLPYFVENKQMISLGTPEEYEEQLKLIK